MIKITELIELLETNQYYENVLCVTRNLLRDGEEELSRIKELKNKMKLEDEEDRLFLSPSKLIPKYLSSNDFQYFMDDNSFVKASESPSSSRRYEDSFYTNLSLLSHALANNTRITHLSFSDCGLDLDSAKIVAELCSQTKTIKILDLWGNEIGKKGLELIMNSLCNNKELLLEELSIGENCLVGTDIDPLAKYLGETTSLRCLDISCNEITLTVLNVLSQILTRKNCTLQALSMIRVSRELKGIGGPASKGEHDVFCGFFESLAQNDSLKLLDLQQNPLTKNEFLFLSKMLEHNQGLKTLVLMDTSMTSDSAFVLGKAISKNRTLTYFNIARNPKLTEQDNEELKVIIEKDTRERKDDGEKKEIVESRLKVHRKGAGIERLIHGIILNDSLLVLNMNECGFTNKLPFLKLIYKNKCLRKIYLSQNKFSKHDTDFFEALRNNHNLDDLSLGSSQEDNYYTHALGGPRIDQVHQKTVHDKMCDELRQHKENRNPVIVSTFLMGTHPKAGKESSILNHFCCDALYDSRNSMRCIFEFLDHRFLSFKKRIDLPQVGEASKENQHSSTEDFFVQFKKPKHLGPSVPDPLRVLNRRPW